MSTTRSGENSHRSANNRRRGPGKKFPRGKSGNPAGRPKKDFDLVQRCRELTPDIIERYGKMGKKAKTGAEVLAGRIVIEYGHDKPRQRHELTGPDGKPLQGVSVVLTLPENGRDVAKKDE